MMPTGRLRSIAQSKEQQLARKPPIPERDVHSVLHTMCWRPQHSAKAGRKKVGNEIHYRIFKQDKAVSVEELTTKLRPIVEGPKAEGKKNMQQGSSQSPWARKAAAVHATGAVASDLGLGQRHRE